MTERSLKRLALTLVFTSTVAIFWSASHASANEKFFAAETVEAKKLPAIPATPRDGAWSNVPAASFGVYAQKTVRLNDRRANAALEKSVPGTITVRAAHTDREIGLWIEWKDPSRTLFTRTETNSFGDSVAIEFPERFGEKQRLPHIGMGDEGSPVRVYMQRAAEEGTLVNEYVARGFGSLTRVQLKDAGNPTRMKMEYDSKAGVWRAVFARAFETKAHSLKGGLIPIAFAVWNGERNERGGNKYLSSWKFVRIAERKVSPKYLKEVAYGYEPGDLGDVARGKAKVASMCVGCHWVGDSHNSPWGFAPDLATVGGISTYSYLRDSIADPNAVVVRNLHINRHYDKNGKPDKFKAYPNNPAFEWHLHVEKKIVSKMPSFGLPAPDLADVVAYLKTLDGSRK